MAPPITYYTVTYITEYGTAPIKQTAEDNVLQYDMLKGIQCNGATFVGWCYSDGTMAYIGDAVTSDITLYAKWEVNRVVVEEPRLHAIADAIRSKNGETTMYRPKDMATAIRSMSTNASGCDFVEVVCASHTTTTLTFENVTFKPKYFDIIGGYANYTRNAIIWLKGEVDGGYQGLYFSSLSSATIGTSTISSGITYSYENNTFTVNATGSQTFRIMASYTARLYA